MTDSVRFAYADPPYPGQARKSYGRHADFGGEVDQADLIAQLERDFPDGWALSTSASALQQVLALCPAGEPAKKRPGTIQEGTGIRVLSWCKPNARVLRGTISYSWEPVILRGGRRPDPHLVPPRDFLVCPLWKESKAEDRYGGNSINGIKPPPFSRWLFACAGLRHGDEFVDLFHGSGSVTREWAKWSAQVDLLGAVA